MAAGTVAVENGAQKEAIGAVRKERDRRIGGVIVDALFSAESFAREGDMCSDERDGEHAEEVADEADTSDGEGLPDGAFLSTLIDRPLFWDA